jgi:peptide/nickel transport system substrate-binding protein
MGLPGQTSVVYRTEYSIFDGLLGLDYRRNAAVRPMLAEGYRRVDDHAWEFILRRGVIFHDGREMTADDVVFSFGPERLTGKDAPGHAALIAFLPTLDSVEKVDERTVRLTTKSPDPAFDKRLASWGGQVISRDAYLRATSFQAWGDAPVGAGPYRVADFKHGYAIELERHDAYWGGKPPYAGIRFRLVPELPSRVAGLLSGDFDIATDMAPDVVAEIERRPGFRVLDGGSNVTRMVVLDAKHNPQLADLNLRRALILGVDRDLLVRTLLAGHSTVPNGFQSPSFGEMYDPTRSAPAYDPERAKALLRQSSYRGEAIAFRTTGTYYVAERETTEALASMWAAIGINIRIETVETYPQWYARPGSGMYNYSSVALFPDPLASLVRNFGPTGQVQTIEDSWSNAEFNGLAAKLATTSDLAERQRLHKRMLDIIEWEDPAMVLLFMQPMLYGVRAGLDWTPYPAHQMDFGPFNAPRG